MNARTGSNRLAFSTRTIHGGQSHDPLDRRGHGADLRHLDLWPAEPGRAQGLRICPQPEPDALRLRALHRRPRKRRRRLRLRLGPGGDRHGASSCSTAGAHVVATDDLYGGTFRLFERVRKRSAGLDVSFVDFTDLAAVEAAIRPETRMLWVETPTNPLLRVVDLEGVAALARKRGPDLGRRQHLRAAPTSSGRSSSASTSSCIRRPNISTAIPTWSAASRRGRRRQGARATGCASCRTPSARISGPFDSFLALRGLKTLALRMERHSANGMAIADWLETPPGRAGASSIPASPAIRSTQSPSARCTPSAAWSRSSSTATSPAPSASSSACRLFTLAESLGGVESLIEHPALDDPWHASRPSSAHALGISDSLVRLSAGIEDADDLIADLEQALA